MTTRRRLPPAHAVALLVVALWAPGAARAATCPAMPGATGDLAAIDAEERLRFVQRSLDRSARHSRAWSYAWGSLYGALAVGTLVAQPWRSDEGRKDGWISAGSSALGVASIALMPPRVIADQRRLQGLLASGAGIDRCALLVEAERLLVRDEKDQRRGRGPLMHVAVTAYNVGVGLTLALALRHWDNAGITIGSGMFLSVLQIGTRPAGLVGQLERYRRGDLADLGRDGKLKLVWAPVVGKGRIGLAVGGAF